MHAYYWKFSYHIYILLLIFYHIIYILLAQVNCAVVAILLHYFFLASFMWMLMEGVFLYVTLIKVFSQINWKYYVAFTVFCYGKLAAYSVNV